MQCIECAQTTAISRRRATDRARWRAHQGQTLAAVAVGVAAAVAGMVAAGHAMMAGVALATAGAQAAAVGVGGRLGGVDSCFGMTDRMGRHQTAWHDGRQCRALRGCEDAGDAVWRTGREEWEWRVSG